MYSRQSFEFNVDSFTGFFMQTKEKMEKNKPILPENYLQESILQISSF